MKNIIRLFEAYNDQLNWRFDRSQDQIIQISGGISEKKNLLEAAIWLWVLMEHIERSKVDKLLVQYEEKIKDIISSVINNWDKAAPNILEDDSEMVHISNVGIYYGALNVSKRVTGKEEIQETLTAIRDYVFEHGLLQGMLVRSPDNKEVSTDLLVTVMPFGLFSPEDLVMVEAVKEIEDHLVTNESVIRYRGAADESPVSAAWLAWYFAEKGNLNKAKYYLMISKNLTKTSNQDEKAFAEALIKIVDYFISDIFQSAGEIKIVHTPYGNDNPYEFLKTERIPREPEVNQEVRVQAQLWPEQENVQVFVKVETVKRQFLVNCLPIKIDNEVVWEAALGSFSFEEEVNYCFLVKKEDKVINQGDIYSFSPLNTNHLVSIEKIGEKDNAIWFQGQDSLNISSVYLGILSTGEGPQFIVDFKHNPLEKYLRANIINDTNAQIKYSDQGEFIIIHTNTWVCRLEKSPFQIKVSNSLDNTLLQGYDQVFPVLRWFINSKGEISRAEWNFKSGLDERFFGFGERYNRFEQHGEKLDCYVYNQYRDQGTRTYLPVPLYLSSLGYGLFLETAFYSVFDVGSNYQELLSISSNLDFKKPSCAFRLFLGKPKEILQKYTNVTGKPVLPPKWAFGPWMSSNNWDRDSIVREQVEKTKKYQIPATVLVIEQWSDEATYYIFNDAQHQLKSGNESIEYADYYFPEWGRWPDPKTLVEYLHDNDLKLILWQIPVQKYLNKQYHLQKDEDERQMLEAGFHVRNHDGTPYRIPEGWFKGSLLMDFSNIAGSKWWFSKRQYLLDIGVDGFKTDGGEFVFGRNLQFADGKTGGERRNLYPNDYVQAYYQFASEYHQGNALTFSRAGYTGAQNFPAHWAGDERSSFEAFRNSLIAGLTSGLSGIPFWGWDLAGFNGDIPTAELFIRSAQMAAFCPIMQYHAESKGEFNQDRTPWNIAERTGDSRAIEGYKFFANLRMNLLPYIYDQAKAASRTGIPLMRALFVEYPEDPKTYSLYNQYLFGDYLLVAPIVEENSTERMVYFPTGKWIDLWSNETIVGPIQKRVHAPLMKIPVYVKSGSAILCNCDSSLLLGSDVGSEIDKYDVPIIRLYPEEEMEQVVQDHLNNKWVVKTKITKGKWDLQIIGLENAVILIPEKCVEHPEFTVNGKIINLSEAKFNEGLLRINWFEN